MSQCAPLSSCRLSAFIHLIGVTGEEAPACRPSAPFTSLLLHETLPQSSHQGNKASRLGRRTCIRARCFYAPLHIELCLTPGADERLTDQTWPTVSWLRGPRASRRHGRAVFRMKIKHGTTKIRKFRWTAGQMPRAAWKKHPPPFFF